jgi:hypothetical protein
MALIGKKIAVVSLGVSCQTTRQIENNRERLARKLDDELEQKRLPFDWRMQPVDAVAKMVRDGEFYPPEASELGRDRRRYWARGKTWFWHDKWDDFRSFQAKQAHLVDNWKLLAKTPRIVFVVSNSQNNLARQAKEFGGIEIPVRIEAMFELLAVLETSFRDPELHLVTRPELVPDLGAFGFSSIAPGGHAIRVRGAARGSVTVHGVPADKSQWEGPTDAWRKVIDRIVLNRPKMHKL